MFPEGDPTMESDEGIDISQSEDSNPFRILPGPDSDLRPIDMDIDPEEEEDEEDEEDTPPTTSPESQVERPPPDRGNQRVPTSRPTPTPRTPTTRCIRPIAVAMDHPALDERRVHVGPEFLFSEIVGARGQRTGRPGIFKISHHQWNLATALLYDDARLDQPPAHGNVATRSQPCQEELPRHFPSLLALSKTTDEPPYAFARKERLRPEEWPQYWPPVQRPNVFWYSPDQPPFEGNLIVHLPMEHRRVPPLTRLARSTSDHRTLRRPFEIMALDSENARGYHTGAELLLWTLSHPRIWKTADNTTIPVIPFDIGRQWVQPPGLRFIYDARDPLSREYLCPMMWRGYRFPFRECAIQMERLLIVDSTMRHPHQAHLFISRHASNGPRSLREAVQRHLKQLYRDQPQRRETWPKLRFSVLYRIYIQEALTNPTMLAHLLDPSVRKFVAYAPTDQVGHHLYSETENTEAGFPLLLLLVRDTVRRILFRLRSYVVDPNRLSSPKHYHLLTENLRQEYRILYEFHALYRPNLLLTYPIDERTPPPPLPGGNERFSQS